MASVAGIPQPDSVTGRNGKKYKAKKSTSKTKTSTKTTVTQGMETPPEGDFVEEHEEPKEIIETVTDGLGRPVPEEYESAFLTIPYCYAVVY